MIETIGFDIVDVKRIARLMAKPRFLHRILTARERETPASAQRVAGRWAAKEAVAKCLGLHLAWHDVEILNDETGRPHVVLRADILPGNAKKVHVSISHEKEYAAAVAVLEVQTSLQGSNIE